MTEFVRDRLLDMDARADFVDDATAMSTVKKGLLTASGEWRKHLRWMKRGFWKTERRAAKKAAQQNAS